MSARCGGFTLVEMMVAVALACLLAAMAWPAYEQSALKARRADAVASLTRVQIAQEQFRANNGSYSQRLSALRGAGESRSPGGAYDIALHDAGLQSYSASATARSDGPQARDGECPRLVVTLHGGLAERFTIFL